MSEKKLFIIGGIITAVFLVGVVFLISNQASQQQAQLSKPLVGREIPIQGRDHVPDGTKVDYSSNPPTSGPHYATPQTGGIYDKPVADGNLVHSMEHGAVILWYKPASLNDQTKEGTNSANVAALSPQEIDRLKQIFDSASADKKIMVPRDNLDVPVALTSWGRLLKLQTIDPNQIKNFMEINVDRGPEQAPL